MLESRSLRFILLISCSFLALYARNLSTMNAPQNLTPGVIAFLVLGAGLFFHGFRALQRKRLIENLPTSKIRSMPLGPVELAGTAVRSSALFSPFTATPCAFFTYRIEEYRSDGKRSRWVTIRQGDSRGEEFAIEDETGRVRVAPEGAEVFLLPRHVFENNSDLPGAAASFLTGEGITPSGLFGLGPRLRLTESYLEPGDRIYLLGNALPLSQVRPREAKQGLLQKLRAIRQDPEAMARIDTDRDGQVSAEEWEAARKATAGELVEELSPEKRSIIARGHFPLVISDKSEMDLLARLKWRIAGGIFGGGLLMAVAGAAYLAQNQ
ncbi:MAG: E3 ubiquitin ligase family protein [Oligoflexia bacterium]|nr:E3 ubiquitin ligase family protein [Oligoflexia bacterium]